MMNDDGEIAVTVLAVATSTGIIAAASVNDALNGANQLLVIVGTLLAGATWLNKRWNRALERRITDAIAKATKPIQPDANGGKSLADLHHKLDGICGRMDTIEARQLANQEQIRDLTDHVRPTP